MLGTETRERRETTRDVKVIALKSDQVVQTLPFAEDMTAADYLWQAKVKLVHGEALTIDGHPAVLDSPVPAGAEIIKAPRISNG